MFPISSRPRIWSIDSTKTDKAKLAKLEEMLYGTDGDQATEPTLPMPEKVIELTKAAG